MNCSGREFAVYPSEVVTIVTSLGSCDSGLTPRWSWRLVPTFRAFNLSFILISCRWELPLVRSLEVFGWLVAVELSKVRLLELPNLD